MKELRNKPRVFLSHSKKDSGFIKQIYEDLRKCQINPWLDEVDIRHGEPWLDAIFEDGIPTCDCVLVYLTENSITSPMVKKEIDASLIQKLKDSGISFLPYVSFPEVRDSLRVDIQALQVPVWNSDSYSSLLPCVVAEIWHGYLERVLAMATNEEKRKRLELELQIEKNKDGDIFTTSENKDFSYIKDSLDYDDLTGFALTHKKTKDVEAIEIDVNLLSLIPSISGSGFGSYYENIVTDLLRKRLGHDGVLPTEDRDIEITAVATIDISNELLTFGLIEPVQAIDSGFGTFSFHSYEYPFTKKMHRFRYWLAYNDLFSPQIKYCRKE